MCVMRRRIHVCPVRACVTCNQSVLCECVGSTEQSKARSKQHLRPPRRPPALRHLISSARQHTPNKTLSALLNH